MPQGMRYEEKREVGFPEQGAARSGRWTSIESEAGQRSDGAKTFLCEPRINARVRGCRVRGCTGLSLSGAEHRAATLSNAVGLRYRARLLKNLLFAGNQPAKM